jgi:hypothetical protein
MENPLAVVVTVLTNNFVASHSCNLVLHKRDVLVKPLVILFLDALKVTWRTCSVIGTVPPEELRCAVTSV